MVTVNEALNNIISFTSPLEKYRTSLIKSIGYFLSDDIVSPIHMPPFRQSAMDGYAINFNHSKSYKLIGEIKAGDSRHPVLEPGEAVRIFTGAPVPDTSNAVIMQEKVLLKENLIEVNDSIDQEINIRPLGEQVKKGHIALKKGTKLTPAAIGFLASLGITEIDVYKKPSLAIVTTGDELINGGQPLRYGQIYESNSIMLLSALKNLGYVDIKTFKIKDDYNNTQHLLQQVITNYDVVLVSGGISVGDYDFVGKALKALNVKQIFYKVKQKPGKPLFFGKKGNTLIFALPGNPAAALSCFYVYVYRALQILSGNENVELTKIKKKSTSEYIKKGDRAQFLKAIAKEGYVTILEGQSSAMLQTFAMANALVYIPENTKKVEVNDTVEVISLPN